MSNLDDGQRPRSSLAGRVAVVTGGGAPPEDHGFNIGAAIAIRLACAGAHVVVLDLDHAAGTRTVERIAVAGGSGTVIAGDVTNRADCDRALAGTFVAHGRVDILINNAAVLGEARSIEAGDEEFLRTIDVNLMGAVRMCRAFMTIQRRGGAIVNVSSVGALRACGTIDYAASKGAMNSLTKALAQQFGPAGVRVNAICPGMIWTPMNHRNLVALGYDDGAIAAARHERSAACLLAGEGSAWDIADATRFLASDEAAWITGAVLVVDGGFTSRWPASV